jgi:hypothetical protein
MAPPMWTLLRREYRSLPPAYWTIWLGMFVNRLGGVVVPFLALYVTRERGESEATAGVVMSLYGAGVILAGLVCCRQGNQPDTCSDHRITCTKFYGQ